MKVLTSCVFVAFVAMSATAPTEQEIRLTEQLKKDFLRDKRSQYGIQYVSPCAAAAAAPVPAFGPHYHYDVAPMHGGYVVPHYGYGGPHYRSTDTLEEQELLFSDMDIIQERMPMARYGAYGTVPVHAGGPMVIPAPAPSPAAYGVFPNANPGGCNVPLLFSCSPSIVQGRIMQAQPHQHVSFGAAGDAYRGVIDPHADLHGDNHEEPSHEHSTAEHAPSHISLHNR